MTQDMNLLQPDTSHRIICLKVDKAKDVAQSVLKALLIVAIVCTALVVAVIAILWKKHKGEEITNQTPPNPGYTEDPTETSSIYQETEEEQ